MHRHRGFTLTELSVTLGIAGLLASLAIPSFGAMRERMRVSTAITDILTLEGSIERWRTNTFDLPASLAEAGLDDVLDPWGNPYRYVRIATARTGEVRRDRNLRPINSDYDLYSMGKDGDTQTQLQGQKARDDIVRANDGGYLGLAQDY